MIVVTFDFRMGPMGYFRPPGNLTLSPNDDVRSSAYVASISCIEVLILSISGISVGRQRWRVRRHHSSSVGCEQHWLLRGRFLQGDGVGPEQRGLDRRPPHALPPH